MDYWLCVFGQKNKKKLLFWKNIYKLAKGGSMHISYISETSKVNPTSAPQNQAEPGPETAKPTVDTGVSGVQANPSQEGKIVDTYA